MPHDLRYGQWLKPTLALIASDHHEYTAQIQLWTDRLEVDQQKAIRTPNLYPDPPGFEVVNPLLLVISTVRPTLRNREVWTLTWTGESRSEVC